MVAMSRSDKTLGQQTQKLESNGRGRALSTRSRMKTRTFAGGALVFAEGDAGGEAFVVISGMVEISTRRSGKKVVLARLGEGQIFGEMAIISKAPRSASAFCLADCELMVVDQQTLDDKVRSADPFLRFLVRSLIDMVHQTAKKL